MKKIRNTLFQLLSRNWSGLLVASIIALFGVSIHFYSYEFIGPLATSFAILKGIFFILAALMFLGATFHLYQVNRHLSKFPPPGRLIDVGGYKMHILAEGSSHDKPSILWIPGSHDQGLAFHHLHRIALNEGRSILFDRASSGWSDIGPHPRSLNCEVAELHSLLKNANEKGPFVIVAHSFGGLLAQKFAEMYPEQTAGLLLLDSACPDATIYSSFLPNNSVPGSNFGMWFLTAFGLAWIITARMLKNNPPWLSIYEDNIKPQVLLGNCQPKLSIGFMSALKSIHDFPYDMVKGYERLEDVPLISVIPPVPVDRQIDEIQGFLPDFSRSQVSAFVKFRIDAQNQTARHSTKGVQYFSPEGTTHGIPFETPDFVMTLLRQLISSIQTSDPSIK